MIEMRRSIDMLRHELVDLHEISGYEALWNLARHFGFTTVFAALAEMLNEYPQFARMSEIVFPSAIKDEE
jgi:ferritin-like metal-binding protein YciE